MFSRRILHAGSALSLGMIGMKNTLLNRTRFDNFGVETNNLKKDCLIPVQLTPKLYAQPATGAPTTGAKPTGVANILYHFSGAIGLDVLNRNPNFELVEFDDFFVYLDKYNGSPAYTVEAITASRLFPDMKTPLARPSLPPEFYCVQTTQPVVPFSQLHDHKIKKIKDLTCKKVSKVTYDIEHFAREMTSITNGRAIIINGPLYIADQKFLPYVMGYPLEPCNMSKLTIPTHHFYIVVIEGQDGKRHLYSFIVDNYEADRTGFAHVHYFNRIGQYLCPMHVIEHHACQKFFSNSNDLEGIFDFISPAGRVVDRRSPRGYDPSIYDGIPVPGQKTSKPRRRRGKRCKNKSKKNSGQEQLVSPLEQASLGLSEGQKGTQEQTQQCECEGACNCASVSVAQEPTPQCGCEGACNCASVSGAQEQTRQCGCEGACNCASVCGAQEPTKQCGCEGACTGNCSKPSKRYSRNRRASRESR